MRVLLLALSLFALLFATAPAHTWSGYIKECANIELHKSKDYNFTQEELDTIISFTCNYGEEMQIEPICDLNNTKSLVMRGNYTYSTIPTCISNLTHLEILDMSGSRLQGDIPTEIGTLTKLTKIDLSNNDLTKIPKSIGNLTSLKELHIASNKLVQKLPSELGTLSSLEKLYLQDNKLFGEIPPELGDDMFLSKLRLNQNNLKGEVPHNLVDLDLTQPNGLGLHENCNLYVTYPDCNRSDENDTADCTWWDESNETEHFIDAKSSLYRGYDGMRTTGGHCWTPAMIPVIWYLLSDTNDTNAT